MKRLATILLTCGLMILAASSTSGRAAFDRPERPTTSAAPHPAYCNTAHNVGRIALGISNDGTFGTELSVSGYSHDCFTGERLPSCEYPRGSLTQYLFAGVLWIGAVVGSDTLVSTGADGWSTSGNEFHPDEAPAGNMIYRSTVDPMIPWYEGAISEQDFIAVYSDTCLNCIGVSRDQIDNRYHRPLDIEVTQRSYAWSYPHTEDFVLIDYEIKNIGSEALSQMYLGLLVDADIQDEAIQGGSGAQDDISGFLSTTHEIVNNANCQVGTDVGVAWAADADGDLGQVVFQEVPHVTGVHLVRSPMGADSMSFNWWVSNGNAALDFGPMMRANERDLSTGGTGTPEGDRNKYYLLSNGDFDYDQVRVATIGEIDPIWLPPPPDRAPIWATGLDTRYVLSFGPVTLEPGESAPFTIAYVAGENLHIEESNFQNLPLDPDAYLDGLDFTDLSMNAIWAGWVYDNPGVDTDSDGYAGEYQMCEDDTVWLKGDGNPDWRATGPPAAPTFWVEPLTRALRVRWNGFQSETIVDWASRIAEFEGYNLYLSTTGSAASFARYASYDVEDYFAYRWDFQATEWELLAERLTFETALCRYAPSGCDDPQWHPMDYTRQNVFIMPGHPDSIFYFEPIMANAFRFGLETPFVKRFPAAPRPDYLAPEDVPIDSVDFYLTDDGYFKYYEYECLIEDLLPEQSYWITVTSFEYGSLLPGASPLESEIARHAQVVRPYIDPLCCLGRVGDVNGEDGDEPTLGDVVLLIDGLFITANPATLPCLLEADVNQSGGASATPDDITIGDIAYLIDYLFITGTSLGLADCL